MKLHALSIGVLFGVGLVFGSLTPAQALPCDQGGVSGSVSCQDGAPGSNNDFPAPDTVNDQTFFTYNDWVYLSKFDVDESKLEEPFDVDWLVTPDDAWDDDEGNWSFNSAVWSMYTDVMIVVKSGNNDGIFFSGYLLDNLSTPFSGTWDTGDKDLSHLTLYARGDSPVPDPIPEPATMLLFGAGLAGLAGFRRRKNK